jgi:hypothetical protein
VPAKKGIEVSCTGGVTDKGKWIRLFPVPYRFLDGDKRFKKYEWIKVSVTKASRQKGLNCEWLARAPRTYKATVASLYVPDSA